MLHRTIALFALLLSAAACSTQDIGLLKGAELKQSLVGTYAVHDRVASVSTLPGLGEYEMLGHYYGISVIEAAGESLQIRQTYCFGNVDWDGPVEIIMSPEAIASTPPFEAELAIDDSADRATVSRPLLEVGVGFNRSADNGALPTDLDDERRVDSDNDGNPGVTVQMEGPVSGDIYVVRIERNQWQAKVEADGALSGLIQDTSEQLILDASDPVLMLEIEDVPDPDPTKSTVRLVQVDPAFTCEDLADTYQDLDL